MTFRQNSEEKLWLPAVQRFGSPPNPNLTCHITLFAPSFSTRSHLVQDVLSLDGSLARFQRLVKFEYIFYRDFQYGSLLRGPLLALYRYM